MIATNRRWFIAAIIVLPLLLTVLIVNISVKPTLFRLELAGGILSADLQPSSIPDLPWTWRANLVNQMHPRWKVPITTNEQGFRTGIFTPKGERRRIVILGDSIMFGIRLIEDETLAGRLARETNADIFNLGVPTYHLPQKMAVYEHFGRDLAPDLVILQMKPGDFIDRKPLMVSTWQRRIPLLLWIHYRLHRLGSRDGRRAAGLGAMHAWVDRLQADGTPLLVLYYPYLITEFRTARWHQDLADLQAMNLPLIDVGALLDASGATITDYQIAYGDLIHPNAQVQALTAAAIRTQANRFPSLKGSLPTAGENDGPVFPSSAETTSD